MKPTRLQTASGWVQEGLKLQRANRAAEAADCYRRALEINPATFDALQLLGVLRFRSGELPAGIELLERALALQPGHAPTLNNLGNALRAAGRLAEALSAYQRAAALTQPPNALILRNLGSALLESGELSQAARYLAAAFELAPADAVLLCWIGHLQRALERPAQAVAAYRRALALDAGLAQAYRGLGSALRDIGESAEARSSFARAFELEPQLLIARVLHADLGLSMAAWDQWPAQISVLTQATPTPGHAIDPLPLCFFSDDATVLRAYADAFAGHSTATAPRLSSPRRSPREGATRLRLAYLSADIRDHPVARLIAGVLEQHDRTRFDVKLYALGPDSDTPIRRRIATACEHFVALEAPGNYELANRIAADENDILVDLMGYTAGGRPRVLAARPAEIQVTWLGYPCTLGGTLADYLITDGITSPPGCENGYAERLIRLPHTFLPNDRTRVIGPPLPRVAYELPHDALVLCSFNQVRKLNPLLFNVWMDVLKAVPRAVLWLSGDHPKIVANLRAEAEARRVAPDRLIFGARLPRFEDHLARYCVADLALDTFPYGSHSTAADALWVGCPLVALVGDSFASRVSASVVTAAGIPELVTNSFEGYRDLILQLANDPAHRQNLRARLEGNRLTNPLFDIRRFVRALEQAYLTIHERKQRGLEPADFSAADLLQAPDRNPESAVTSGALPRIST